MRLPGIAPGPSTWQEDILLLNHSREIKRAGSFTLPAHAISTKNKHLLVIYSIPTRGFTAAVSVFGGTPPPKPLNCKSASTRLGAMFSSVWAHHTGGTPLHSCVRIRLALSDIIKMSLCYRSQIVAFRCCHSASVSGNKKPCLRCGKQGEREIRLSFFRTCLHRDYPNYLRAVAQWVRGIASG